MNQDQLREAIAMAIARYDWNHGLSANGTPGQHTMGETDAVLEVVAPLLADRDRELERWRTGLRRHSWPTVKSVPDGLQYAAALARAQGTEGGDEHDELLRQAAIRLRDLSDVARVLLADRARVEASRRDWATEALRLNMAEEAKHCAGARSCPANVHYEGCLYGDTGLCCDSPQPIGDAGEPDENVVTCGNCGEDMDPDMLERLRYAPLPQCSVHPGGGEGDG